MIIVKKIHHYDYVNPAKYKTKTMVFIKQQRTLPNLKLCGNPLPWTDKIKHLGTIFITDRIDGCEEDIRIKNPFYIEKNVELNQEFFFAHLVTKLKLNSIYNSRFTSSALWNLFENGSGRMLDLPFATHRSLIEPLTGQNFF